MKESLPTGLADGQMQVLDFVKRNGPTTLAALASDQKLSVEAARRRMDTLLAGGFVARFRPDSARGAGRPELLYVLTLAGQELFPRRYHDLAASLLEALGKHTRREQLRGILASVAQAKLSALRAAAPHPKSLPRSAAALTHLKNLYAPDDPYMEVGEDKEGPYLLERNCPFLRVALEHPRLCSLTLQVLSSATGRRVTRDRSFQNEDGCCRFRISVAREEPGRFVFEDEVGDSGVIR